jgi:hypothetical protein
MFQLNRQSMRFNDKLYIVKKTIDGERINDLELAKEYYGADYILRPKTSNDYIFLETIQDLEYEQINEPKGHPIAEHNEVRQEEAEQSSV